jgi:hypothetical protein
MFQAIERFQAKWISGSREEKVIESQKFGAPVGWPLEFENA